MRFSAVEVFRCLVLRLPAVPATGAAATPPVIEDEPNVARVTKTFLTRAGYHAAVAERAEDALGQLAAGEHYDALLVDLKMPGMGGERFFRILRRMHPHLARRVVFMSGDGSTPQVHAFVAHSGQPALAKPFELSSLRDALDRVLAA